MDDLVNDFRSHFVYRCFDSDENLLYVGCAMDVPQRLRLHRTQAEWFPLLEWVSVAEYGQREWAINAERKAILSENPRFNRDRSPVLFNVKGAYDPPQIWLDWFELVFQGDGLSRKNSGFPGFVPPPDEDLKGKD